jgi:hypothetical protein
MPFLARIYQGFWIFFSVETGNKKWLKNQPFLLSIFDEVTVSV